MSSSSLLSTNEPGALALGETVQAVGHGIVSRTLLATPELRVVLFSFAAGQTLTEHASPSRALIQVLAGACEFSVAGQPRTLRAGDLLHLPPNVPHAVQATEPFTMLLTLAPPRKNPAAG
jgi:quercetin dioxygenase-like cupin family protein